MDANVESTITVVGNLAIAASFVAALVFGIVQVRGAARDRRERLTLETIRSFQTREFSAHFVGLRERGPPETTEAFYAIPHDDQVTFVHFAYEMELLGLLVHDGLIDVDLVERTLGDFVSVSWEKYAPLLRAIRKENEDRYLGEYFEWLARRIDARMAEHPREPAHLAND